MAPRCPLNKERNAQDGQHLHWHLTTSLFLNIPPQSGDCSSKFNTIKGPLCKCHRILAGPHWCDLEESWGPECVCRLTEMLLQLRIARTHTSGARPPTCPMFGEAGEKPSETSRCAYKKARKAKPLFYTMSASPPSGTVHGPAAAKPREVSAWRETFYLLCPIWQPHAAVEHLKCGQRSRQGEFLFLLPLN